MRNRNPLVWAVAVSLGGLAFAQPLPPGARKGASIEGITEYTLSNGLQVLVFPDASNPKVTVNMTVLVGSRHEGYGETGMAHLLEHLLFMRTTSGRDIKKELTGHGASWNGSTSSDRTNYFETVTASEENLRWAIGLEADRLVNSIMDKALLDTEMTVVRNEFERGENSASRVLSERVEATAYLWHNYGKPTIGSRADIENVPIERLAAFYRKYYQPDNAVLAVAGQLNEAHTIALIAETFGKIPRPKRKLDPSYTVEPAQDGERYVALRRVGEGQIVTVAWHTPAAGHPDSAAVEVMAGILGGGGGFRGGGGMATGRLYKALVDNKLAISASMYARQSHDPGLAIASAELSGAQSLAEARRVVVQTVEGLAAEPPTREEVERVKTRLVRAQEMRLADSQNLCLSLSESAADGDWRLIFLNRDRLRKVTPEDVARVARTYFLESNRTVGEFIPTKSPVRAEIPATPDLAAVFKDYKGGEALAHGEAFDATPANIEKRLVRTQLPGGAKLLMLPRQTRGNLVSAVLDLNFGDVKMLAGARAAAQIAGGLLMRGTRGKTRQQLQDEMDRLKARIFVSGGGGGGGGGRGGRRGGPTVTTAISNATASIETTPENLAGALRLAVEMLREPAFAESDFEQVRGQRIASLEADRAEPASLALLSLQRHLSPFAAGDPRYVGTLDEQIAELKRVTLDDVKNFHRNFYGASHGILVAAGRFDQAAFQKSAGEILGGWPSAAPYQRLSTPFHAAAAENLKIETPDKQNAQFEAGLRFRLSEDDPDYPAMLLGNQMFGGSLGARMPNRIRNLEGLSYSVASRITVPANGDGAEFTGAAISAPQNTPRVEASFTDELAKTLQSGFTAAEVETAKKAYLNAQTVARSQETGLVRLIASREQSGRSLKWDEELEAKVQGLTPEQINAAFRRYLDPAKLTIVKAGDFQKAGAYK